MGVGTHYTYTAPLVRGTGNENCYQTYNGDQPQKQPRHPLPAPSWLSRRAAPASARARACRVLTAARAGGCGRTGAQTRNAVAPAGQAPPSPPRLETPLTGPAVTEASQNGDALKVKKKKSIPPHTKKLVAVMCRQRRDYSDNDYFQSYYLYCTINTSALLCPTHMGAPDPSESLFPVCFHPGQKPEKRQEPQPAWVPTGWVSITSTRHRL